MIRHPSPEDQDLIARALFKYVWPASDELFRDHVPPPTADDFERALNLLSESDGWKHALRVRASRK